jgi:hypothetical protein
LGRPKQRDLWGVLDICNTCNGVRIWGNGADWLSKGGL